MYQINRQTSLTTKIVSAIALGVALLLMLPVGLIAQQEESQKQEADRPAQQDANGNEAGVVQSSARSTSDTGGKRGIGMTIGSLADFANGNPEKRAESSAETATDRSDVSVTVNQNGRDESLKIKWNKDGLAEVTYSLAQDGKKISKTYNLKEISELADKNKEAFRFYRAHVNVSIRPTDARTVGTTSTEKTTQSSRPPRVRAPRTRVPRTRETGSNPRQSQSSSDSSSSSAWQTSSMINNNGVISRSQDSGKTGNGVVGGNTNGQMIDQIKQMIDQTDNPQMKNQLQQMLDRIQGK